MNAAAITDFNELDLSVLVDLAELQARRTLLVGRLTQMDERRSDVAPAVYLRVRADYEQQRKKLEGEESPLKQTARSIYARVRDRFDVLEREEGDARLNLQELEFRNSLGEFDKAQFNVRKSDIDVGIAERAESVAQAKKIRQQFLAIFGDESELEEVSPEGVTEKQVHAPPANPVSAPVVPAQTAPIIQQAPLAPQIPGMPALPEMLTSLGMPSIPNVPPILNMAQSIPTEAKPEPKNEPRRPANPDATVVFRPGRLTPMNPEAGIAPTMLSLKPISIGSDSACDVRISAPGVQPKHVEISLTRAGFILKDLIGGAVVTIDGQSVSEQLLRDGDAVQVGPARFSFKLA